MPRAGRDRGPMRLLMVVAAIAMAGCAAAPPEPTRIEATVAAGADVNPDAAGEASPIFVRLYELTSDTTFATATFNELYNDEQATLGETLRGREDVSLAPGQSTTVSREFQDGSRFLGVLAAFQDIDGSRWRATAPVPANATTAYQVSVGRADVAIEEVGL